MGVMTSETLLVCIISSSGFRVRLTYGPPGYRDTKSSNAEQRVITLIAMKLFPTITSVQFFWGYSMQNINVLCLVVFLRFGEARFG